jgi:hypothetical protein
MGKSFQVTTTLPSKSEIMQGIYPQQWTDRIACFYLPIIGRSSRSDRAYQKHNSRNCRKGIESVCDDLLRGDPLDLHYTIRLINYMNR